MPTASERLCTLIVATIHEHSVWLRVTDADSMQRISSHTTGKHGCGLVPCLTLRVSITRGKYTKGTEWSIPKYLLHQTARQLAADDPNFAGRLARMELTRYDVGHIIRLASHGIIHPFVFDAWRSSPYHL